MKAFILSIEAVIAASIGVFVVVIVVGHGFIIFVSRRT
jgi:hypothetical protein